MIRNVCMFFIVLFAFEGCCCAVKPKLEPPQIEIAQIFKDEQEREFLDNEEKVDCINSAMRRVWNEDFGKFAQLFYKAYFKITAEDISSFETFPFTEDTVSTGELLMKYLVTSSSRCCLNFFRGWVEFFKKNHYVSRKKDVILESLKEFICRFLILLSKKNDVTYEFDREKTAIMCELYELEDKMIFSL